MPACDEGCCRPGARISTNVKCDLCQKPIHGSCTYPVETKTVEGDSDLEIDVCASCYKKTALPQGEVPSHQPSQFEDDSEDEEDFAPSRANDKKVAANDKLELSEGGIKEIIQKGGTVKFDTGCIVQVQEMTTCANNRLYVLIADKISRARASMDRVDSIGVRQG